MFSSRFFRRIFLPYSLVISIATSAVGLFAATHLRDSYLANTRSGLHNESVLVSALLKPYLPGGQTDQLQAEARQIGDALRRRITVIDDDGRVIGETNDDPAQMNNHRSRPEIISADRLGDGSEIRRSQTLGIDLLYFAHKMQAEDGKTFFVRLAVPLAELDQQLKLLYIALGAVVLIAVIAGALMSFYLARRSTTPVLELTNFAKALARGELNRRLLPTENGEIAHLTGALNTMADSLGSLLAQTTKDRAELLAMLSSMSEGVIATDIRQNILLVNHPAGEMLSFDANSAQGKPLWEVVRIEAILKSAGEVIASRESRGIRVSPAAGKFLDVTACTYPGVGPVQGMILVAHDTTQSMRYQELRKEFVANVSHELRTPLAVIKGYTETLRDGALNDPLMAPKFLLTIERHVDQLTNLVSDLLELSKLEGSPELPRRILFDVAAVARRAIDLLLPAAKRKEQTLTGEIPQTLPRVVGNPDYIERAISNLIDNAIKYTPERGKIQVSASIEGAVVSVEVSDNGIGIPPEDLSRVFERFYRVDRSRSREMGGTGLGLSIVKHIVQAHGGSIDVTSTPAQGSKFSLKLPILQAGVG